MTNDAALEVTEITDPKDLKPWVQAMFDSFVGTDNVLFESLFGLPPGVMPNEKQLEGAYEEHSKALTEPQPDGGDNRYIQVLDPATGDVMGGVKWTFFKSAPTRPDRVDVTWIDDATPQGKFEREFTQASFDEFYGRRVKFMNCPHALLYIVFTTPKYERRGVAGALVRWGMEKADKEGWPCFTEASPRGTPLYARMGFNTRETLSLRWDERGEDWKKKGDVRWTFMERPVTKIG